MKLLSNNFSRSGLLMALFALLCNFALAQRTVTGKVTDAENGEALIGATVSVVGTPRGTVTDIDGNYSVAVPAGATQLRFSYTGYAEQSVALGASNTVNVALAAGTKLDEVVVVGYGTLKSKEVSSSIASLKSENFNRGAVNSPVQLMQGKVAGIAIARPGGDPNGAFSFRVRGLSAIGGTNDPLVVIDGVPGASLNSIDPADIETIDVLKDGSAAAIYGTRGSAGVILITTKKGGSGKSSATYEVKGTMESIANHPTTMSASEYTAAGGTNLGNDTDWFGEVTQTGYSHTHNLSFSGGTAKSGYRVGLNYRDVSGVSINDGFKQLNARLAFNQKALQDRLNITSNIAATTRNASYAAVDAFRYATIFNPTAPINFADQNSADAKTFGGYYQRTSFDYFNPVAIANQSTLGGQVNNITANVRGDLDLGRGLSLASSYSIGRDLNKGGEYYSIYGYYRGNANTDKRGSARSYSNQYWDYLFNATLNYRHDFGKVGLNAVVGYEEQEFNYESFFAEGGGFTTDAFSYNNIGAAADLKKGTATLSTYRNRSQLQSVFARGIFSIGDNLSLTASLRQDGSSKFGPDNKRHLFPAVSAAYDLGRSMSIAGANSLKVRVGYGETGSLPRDPYQSIARVAPNGQNFYYNGGWIPAFVQTSNANPELGWESKKETNLGIDFAFMDYRLTGSLDLFRRDISSLLYTIGVPQPPNVASTSLKNVGELRVSGIELLLDYKLVDNDDMGASVNLTAATAKTEMIDIFGADSRRLAVNLGAPGLNNLNLFNLETGKPVGQMIGPVYEGIDDQGKYIFTDQNGDGKIDQEDEVVIGNGLPKLNLGLGSNLRFGALDINFQLRGVFGHDLLHEYRIFYESREPGSIANYNRINTSLAVEGLKEAPKVSSLYVEKGSFVRLDNLTLGYNFKVGNDGLFNSARAYFTGNNLLTFTNYTGVDPEVRYGDPGGADNGGRPNQATLDNPDPLAPGIDRRSTYFTTRQFTLGVVLGF